MPRYKYADPQEWLAERARDWSHDRLYLELMELARQTDSDTLQDIYQSDMDADGYFEDLDAPKKPEDEEEDEN